MRNLKLFAFAALTAGVMVLGTACSPKYTPKETGAAVQTTAAEQTTVSPSSAEGTGAGESTAGETIADESEEQEDKEMTGTFEETTGFSFLLKADSDGELYNFNISDEALVSGLKKGDKVVVTYRGEDPSSTDSTDTMVLEVVKAQS